MEKIMTGDGESKTVSSSDEKYGNTRRQLDRQSEVIDYLASRVQALEVRLEHILQPPEPMPSGPEADSPYFPDVPLKICSNTDLIEEILHRVISITDRIDL